MDKELIQILHSINNNLTILAKNQLKISMQLTDGKKLHIKKMKNLHGDIEKYKEIKN